MGGKLLKFIIGNLCKFFVSKTQFDDMLRSTLIYIDSFLKLKVLEKKELQQKKEKYNM